MCWRACIGRENLPVCIGGCTMTRLQAELDIYGIVYVVCTKCKNVKM